MKFGILVIEYRLMQQTILTRTFLDGHRLRIPLHTHSIFSSSVALILDAIEDLRTEIRRAHVVDG